MYVRAGRAASRDGADWGGSAYGFRAGGRPPTCTRPRPAKLPWKCGGIASVDRDHAARRRPRRGEVDERVGHVFGGDLAREQVGAKVLVDRKPPRARPRLHHAAGEERRADAVGVDGVGPDTAGPE